MALVLRLRGAPHRPVFVCPFRRVVHWSRFRRSPHGINPQQHAPAHLIRIHPVPLPHLLRITRNWSAIPPSVSPSSPGIAPTGAWSLPPNACRRDDQFFPWLQPCAPLQIVGLGNRCRRHPVRLRDRRPLCPGFHPVPSPTHPLVCRDVRNSPPKNSPPSPLASAEELRSSGVVIRSSEGLSVRSVDTSTSSSPPPVANRWPARLTVSVSTGSSGSTEIHNALRPWRSV